MRADTIEVAATVLQDAQGHVLLAERTARQVSAGYWELPGGKVDPGETPAAAAQRELHEEIGVRSHGLTPWLVYEHRFPLRRIRLHLFRAQGWSGTPQGCEGQRLRWVDPARPAVAPILQSNERALAALSLPPLYAIIDADRDDAAAALDRALAEGAGLVQLHAHTLSPEQRSTLARRLAARASAHGARLLLHGSAQEVRRAGIAGLHTEAAELRRLDSRPAVPLWIPCCQDAADLTRAVALGADAVVLGAAAGWETVARLTATVPIGVYAAGGLTAADLPQARRAGAIGIATAYWAPGTGS
jgi:8-oxo-dGTP diphosphatase